jgi:hypothetical protein
MRLIVVMSTHVGGAMQLMTRRREAEVLVNVLHQPIGASRFAMYLRKSLFALSPNASGELNVNRDLLCICDNLSRCIRFTTSSCYVVVALKSRGNGLTSTASECIR